MSLEFEVACGGPRQRQRDGVHAQGFHGDPAGLAHPTQGGTGGDAVGKELNRFGNDHFPQRGIPEDVIQEEGKRTGSRVHARQEGV